MSKNNIEFDDTKLGTSFSESLVSADGKSWQAWEEKSGASVQRFIKQQLASSVSDLKFDVDTSTLSGLNSFGDTVCHTIVTNASPQYGYNFEIKSVYVNGSKHTAGTQIPYSDNLKVEVGFNFKVWYTILSTTNPISIGQTFLFYTNSGETFEVPNIMPQNLDVEEELKVDISNFFKEISAGNLTNVVLNVKWVPTEPELTEQVISYENALNIVKINLRYLGETVVNQTVTFDVDGIPSGQSGYQLEYFDYSIEQVQKFTTAGTAATPQTSPINSRQVTVNVGALGVKSILARVSHATSGLASDWVQINIINTGGSYNGHALIVAQNITNVLNNCNTDKLYDVQVVPGAGGSASVKCYISDNTTNFTKLHKENIFSGLSASDPNSNYTVYSYNEFEAVSSNQKKNISIVLEINNTNYTLMRLSYSGGKIYGRKFFQLSVVQNEYNKNNCFNTSSGAVLDFSQITSTENQVFVKDNIDDNLIQSDGYQQDGMRQMYKVSAQYQNLSEGLFKNPIDLNRLCTLNSFTIDLMYASEYAHDEQPNFSIGNLYFGPGYMYINGDEETIQDSKVSFEKDEVTHLIITYTANYKPNTYPNVYKDFFKNYDKINNSYNVLKIYVNGCINREIQLESTLKLGDFKFQIHPISSNLKLYQFRTYERALNYEEIQKNTISSLVTASDKLDYFNNNDILKEDGTISFWKTYNKHNVLVHVLPYGSVPMWYGNKDSEITGSSLLIHYHNPEYAKYNGRLVGTNKATKEGPQKMVYKNQGSSAKKYMFHNTSVSKFSFQSEEVIAANSDDRSVNYYYMPGDEKIKVKKIVGKVNYASSMQSHKPGSCNTYQDTYADTFKEAALSKMYTGGRKGVYELPYFYFYYIVDQGVDPETVKITDLFEEKTDILGNKYAIEKNVKFFGFQTWGSAKGDKETYGYDEDKTPEYVLLEGADNGNLMPNFKNPWGALQATEGNNKDITRNDRFTGLIIDGATIRYAGDQTNTDPWDIEFGVNDDENGFLDSAKVSVKVFADMVDHIYLYDYLNLRGITEEEISTNLNIKYRYYITEHSTNYRQFDVIRFDQATQQWVPGGLTRIGGRWTRFNLIEFINGLSSTYDDDVINVLRAKNPSILNESIDPGESDPDTVMQVVFRVFPELFKTAVEYYFDYEDLLFHQAFIKVICGTDNRAKNTYYQIIGKVYEEDAEGKFVKTDKGDYKIRLLVDDMDTIFATNNNGQQVIPSHTLEPVFGSKYDSVWNDLHNALLYTCDLLYEDKIFSYVENIISYLIGGNISVKNKETNLYKQYFSIQTGYPTIAYNHHAEIYYDVANLMYCNGLVVTEADALQKLNGFVNNGVSKPLSLSHGRSVESEYQYTTERLTMLGSLCNNPQAKGLYGDSQLINNGTGGSNDPVNIKGEVSSNSYISLIANADGTENYQRVASYTLGEILENIGEHDGVQSIEQILYNHYDLNNDVIKSITYLMTPTSKQANLSITGTSNIPQSILGTDKYRHITINSGLQYLSGFVKFMRAESLSIDGIESKYSCSNSGTIKIADYLYLIQRLSLTNINFTGSNVILDFRNCNKLVSIDLSGCTGIKGIIIPSNKYIESIKLPQNLEILELGYCQNDKFDVELPNSNLKTITLDGRNTTEFINNFIITYVTSTNINLIINNAETITLTNQVLAKLSQMPTLAFIGVNNIITDKMDFQLKLEIYYNSAFNGITISGYPTVEYTSVKFDMNPCIIPRGSSKNYLQYLDFVDYYGNSANNVDISKLKFELSNANGIKFDTKNPLFIVVSDTVPDETSATLVIKYNSKVVKTIELKVGFYAPKVGDFAYNDGTFSPIYSDKAIGYVYKSEVNGQTGNSYNVSIMALNPLNTTVLGFSKSRGATDDAVLTLLNEFNAAKTPNSSNAKLIDLLPSAVNALLATNNMSCMSDLIRTTQLNNYEGQYSLEEEEMNIMRRVITSSVYIHHTLCATSGKDVNTHSLINRFNEYSSNSYNLQFKKDLSSAIDVFDINTSFTQGSSQSYVNAYSCLFPGYVKAYTYYPASCSENSTHKVVRKYLDEPWKIPSTYTVANLVINIMKSLAVNGERKSEWTSTDIGTSGSGIYSTILKNNSNMVYEGKPVVHNYIKFLGSKAKLCSEYAGQNDVWVNYSYHTYTDYTTTYHTFNISTTNTWSYNDYGVRNQEFDTIFPCITITLSKSDYENN